MLHLIGDMHQPLHCATYYSTAYHTGDRGGNEQLIKVNGRVLDLHTYWDGLIGTSTRYGVIAASAELITRDPKYKREALK